MLLLVFPALSLAVPNQLQQLIGTHVLLLTLLVLGRLVLGFLWLLLVLLLVGRILLVRWWLRLVEQGECGGEFLERLALLFGDVLEGFHRGVELGHLAVELLGGRGHGAVGGFDQFRGLAERLGCGRCIRRRRAARGAAGGRW